MEQSTYSNNMFIRRFRMSKDLFFRIADVIQQADDYFVQKYDTVGNLGASVEQKLCACLRLLGDGCAIDSMDDKYRLGASTLTDCLRKFTLAILEARGMPGQQQPTQVLTTPDHGPCSSRFPQQITHKIVVEAETETP